MEEVTYWCVRDDAREKETEKRTAQCLPSVRKLATVHKFFFRKVLNKSKSTAKKEKGETKRHYKYNDKGIKTKKEKGIKGSGKRRL